MLLGGERLHDHEKNTCKYVKPFTPTKEEKRGGKQTKEKGEVCERVRMRLSVNETKKIESTTE